METSHSDRLADEIDHTDHIHLVGRESELQFFQKWLADRDSEGTVLNIYGTGGIGKSYLLREFCRVLGQSGIRFLFVDCHAIPQTPYDFCLTLLELLNAKPAIRSKKKPDVSLLLALCADEIRKAAKEAYLVLILDTFEAFGQLECWFRDEFLRRLNPNLLTILSGRLPLQGEWLSLPAWRKLVYRMPLHNLAYEAVEQYVKLAGIDQGDMIQRVWTLTKGHPLTLSLSVSTTIVRATQQSMVSDEQDIFPYVVRIWLKEVPDPDMRDLVEAAAIARQFNQELLSFILKKHVSTDQFERLVGYSFILRVDRGWTIHDMLRDAIGYELRLRTPDFYNMLWKRCILYHYFQIQQAMQNRTIPTESTNLVYYIGNRLIRNLFYRQSVTYYLEPLQESNWDEAMQYIEKRHQQARDVIIRDLDLDTKKSAEYLITAREGLCMYAHFQQRELEQLVPDSVKLIRDANGSMFGLTEIIPIHEQTIGLLKANPPSAAYFSSLSEVELNELKTPKESIAGYFISFIDVTDYADLTMRQAAGMVFISHMLSAGLLVTTAPEIPFFSAIFHNLGLEKVKGVFHCDYDSQHPTPYYRMDTRGNKLLAYLNAMLLQLGIPQEKRERSEQALLLSLREREIAGLIIGGRSNAEIADNLHLSEATVKKHVSNLFKKLQVRSRRQLMHKYTELVTEL